MKFAYADPPYIGQAKRHYAYDPRCAEVDHAELIERLGGFDGWALSLSSPTLKQVLALCPDDIRIGAWVKPFAFFKPGINPSYAWEPVVFRGGRKRGKGSGHLRDWVSANVMGHHARSKVLVDGKPFSGAKPDAFCWWLFDFLGMEPGDDFHDLFPGSGAVSRAWETYKRAKAGFPLFPADAHVHG